MWLIVHMERDLHIDEFKKDFEENSLEYVSSKWIFERVPYLIGDDYSSFINTRLFITKSLGVDSCSIFFVGSSSVGFSLNPFKNLKPFDEYSDIDIAIISHYYFDVAWRTIQDIDFTKASTQIQTAIKEHRDRLIYWEIIALDKILGVMPFAKIWMGMLESLKEQPFFSNRKISYRLYRNHEALRRYQINNFQKALPQLLGVEPLSITL